MKQEFKYLHVESKKSNDYCNEYSKLDDEINKVMEDYNEWEIILFKTHKWCSKKEDTEADIWLKRYTEE